MGRAGIYFFFSFHPGKAEWVCMLFCIRCPQLVNNSHRQPLSHSPTYLTSIQCPDSPLNVCFAPEHTKNHFLGNMTDAFHNNPLLICSNFGNNMTSYNILNTILYYMSLFQLWYFNSHFTVFVFRRKLGVTHKAPHVMSSIFLPSMVHMQVMLHSPFELLPLNYEMFVRSTVWTAKLWCDEETDTEWCKDR